MKSFLSQKDWEDILTKVYKRAAIDHEFHQLCLVDAHFAIQQATGKKIPKELKIRFVEESDHFVLTLPPPLDKNQKNPTPQWSDAQLESMAEKLSNMLVQI